MDSPLNKLLALIVLSAGAAQTDAATSTTTFLVTATVISTCVIVGTPLAFGNYDPNSATANNATGTVTATCTVGAAYDIGMDAGTAPGATVTTRKMINGTDTLNYALYRDASRTLNWGQTIGTDTLHVASAPVGPDIHTVYGRIPAGQNVPALLYQDTITATITF